MKQQRIALLGPEGTFSHAMSKKLFPENEHVLCQNFERVFHACEHQGCLGVVPIENSLFGAVDEVLDLLINSPVRIWKTIDFPVHHAIGALDPSRVTTIASHPQALAQCRKYLKERYANAYRLPTMSSVQAIELALAQPHIAAIGSAKTMEKMGLSVLETDVQGTGNTTRFALVATDDPEPSFKRKSLSIRMELREDRPGILLESLAPFKEHGRNMSRIVSRPTGTGIGNYVFVIDFEGSLEEPDVQKLLNELNTVAIVRLLGQW